MTAKLTLYNEALGHLKQRKISALTDNVEGRRVLDDYYSGVLDYCLARGFWNFAMRAVSITYSTSTTPQFGYTYAFEKPSDWIRTYQVSDNAYFEPALERFQDEAGFWWADITPMYVRYVSNGASYGLNLSSWPQTFADYVALRLAYRAAPRIGSLKSEEFAELKDQQKIALAVAASTDAMDENGLRPPRGSWASSRQQVNRSPRSQTLGY